MSKVLRKGRFIEVEYMEPGDILVITDESIPKGHVVIAVPSIEELEREEEWNDRLILGDKYDE